MNAESISGTSNLLLTGTSGVGKSTLLRKLCGDLGGFVVHGFISDVIFENDQRVGWRLKSLSGGNGGDGYDGGVLAHVGVPSDHRMGRYGVDMGLFENIASRELRWDDQADLYIIDEVGIIASWSSAFQTAFDRLLDAPTPVIAIIRQKPTDYGERVRHRADVECLELREDNRATVEAFITAWVAKGR